MDRRRPATVERPPEMPIEQASEFELAINMKMAKALGMRIPEALRFRATKLVE
jgi:putative ABC transport system substrate-binding protein